MAGVESGVLEVGVVVVAAGLADGVGRIGDDDADVERRAARRARSLFAGKAIVIVEAAVFSHVEGVGEHDPVEGHVSGLGSAWTVRPWYVASMLMAAM